MKRPLILSALVLCSMASYATPTLVQHRLCGQHFTSQVPSGAKTICGLPNTSHSGNMFVVGFNSDTNMSAITMGCDGTCTWVTGPTVTDAGNSIVGRSFYALNIGGNNTQVTATITGASNFVGMDVTEFSGVATSSATDGTAVCHNATGTSVTSGSITTTIDGDLIWEWTWDTGSGGPITSYTVGSSPWVPLALEIQEATASQYQVQVTHGAINPTLTKSPSSAYVACGIAFKAAASGSGNSGIYVQNQTSVGTRNETATSVGFQCPNTIANGLAVVTFTGDALATVTGITDTSSNTWTQVGTGPGNGSRAQIFYAKNIPASNSLKMTASLTTTSTGNGYTFMCYMIAGADTSAPLDTTVGTSGLASATGNQPTGGAGGNVTVFTGGTAVTPGGTNELEIIAGGIDRDTAQSFTVPTGSAFLGTHEDANNTPQPSFADENNIYGVYYNGASVAAQTWTFTHDTSQFPGVGNWAVALAAFKAPSAGGTTRRRAMVISR